MRYRLEKLIADGDIAQVYSAKDTRLDRSVCLKRLTPSVARDASMQKRFIREARAMATINHPNIVTIHDFVRFCGVSFIVMERLQGSPLNRAIPREGFHIVTGLNLAIQLADGISQIHAVGRVHRDVKPANVFVTREGLLKLLDFGLARRCDSKAQHLEHKLTEMGTVMGTPGYMSPEQLRAGAIDRRSDIFSFGATLYEMLTGTQPFERTSHAETAAAILRDDTPYPAKSLPDFVFHIVRRCLEKDPRSRYQTMRKVLADLRAARDICRVPELASSRPLLSIRSPRTSR